MSAAQPPEDDLEPQDEEQLDVSPRASDRAAPRRGATAAEARPRASGAAEEELPYVDDRASKIWVLAIVGVFVLILAYGLLFGKAGMLTPPTPSPAPTPSAAPTVSASPLPSSSASASPILTQSPVPSQSVAPSITPSAAPSVAPSLSPTPAPSST
jgi:hypothetical protein